MADIDKKSPKNPGDTQVLVPKEDIRSSDEIILPENNNLRILYITLAIVVGLLIIWIAIIIFTREESVKVLGEMNKLATQVSPISDTTIINKIIPPSSTPI